MNKHVLYQPKSPHKKAQCQNMQPEPGGEAEQSQTAIQLALEREADQR